jgi:hypothetical protein
MMEYPDYFEVGTLVLSTEEKVDPMKYSHTCDRDLMCEGLCVDIMVIAYMAATTTEVGADTEMYSHLQMP